MRTDCWKLIGWIQNRQIGITVPEKNPSYFKVTPPLEMTAAKLCAHLGPERAFQVRGSSHEFLLPWGIGWHRGETVLFTNLNIFVILTEGLPVCAGCLDTSTTCRSLKPRPLKDWRDSENSTENVRIYFIDANARVSHLVPIDSVIRSDSYRFLSAL